MVLLSGKREPSCFVSCCSFCFEQKEWSCWRLYSGQLRRCLQENWPLWLSVQSLWVDLVAELGSISLWTTLCHALRASDCCSFASSLHLRAQTWRKSVKMSLHPRPCTWKVSCSLGRPCLSHRLGWPLSAASGSPSSSWSISYFLWVPFLDARALVGNTPLLW